MYFLFGSFFFWSSPVPKFLANLSRKMHISIFWNKGQLSVHETALSWNSVPSITDTQPARSRTPAAADIVTQPGFTPRCSKAISPRNERWQSVTTLHLTMKYKTSISAQSYESWIPATKAIMEGRTSPLCRLIYQRMDYEKFIFTWLKVGQDLF